ncbi:MAG: flagellar FlbD family protein [Deltaproteobacteria bacterium]|nr:flagellar FlbD family protein [Deltaproteobacteria bacterium]
MITVTRLDRTEVLVNEDLIVMASTTPDTTLIFTNGEHLMVRESLDEVRARVLQFKQAVVTGLLHVHEQPSE